MSRRVAFAVIVVVLAVVAAVAGWSVVVDQIASLFRRNDPPAASMPVTAGAPPAPASTGPPATPRVPVTLDARRQQLIGVRTTRAVRVAMTPEVRASGTVRADESRLTEVNVKADGWIRGLRANFTGRPVSPGIWSRGSRSGQR